MCDAPRSPVFVRHEPRPDEAGPSSGPWHYGPDLSPIEMAFSKIKAHLRRLKARTFDALFVSVAQACELPPSQEYENFFKAAG